ASAAAAKSARRFRRSVFAMKARRSAISSSRFFCQSSFMSFLLLPVASGRPLGSGAALPRFCRVPGDPLEYPRDRERLDAIEPPPNRLELIPDVHEDRELCHVEGIGAVLSWSGPPFPSRRLSHQKGASSSPSNPGSSSSAEGGGRSSG